MDESCLLKTLSSPYIVNVEEIFDWDNRLYVFLDYMDGGSIDDIIKRSHETYSVEFIKYTLYMSAMGIKALHDINVIHRDIKSDNILCRPNGEIKVADLGHSVYLTEQDSYRKTRIGTTNWMSPEIILGQMYSRPVDVWSFGALMHELAKGLPPFREIH